MSCRTRVAAVTGALAIACGAAGLAAPVANAAPPKGTCTGAVVLAKNTPIMRDQTQNFVKTAGTLARDETTHVADGGVCAGAGGYPGLPVRPNDPHIPAPTGPLHPTSEAFALLGNPSCANGTNAINVDATKANAWPQSGNITWTMAESYTDIVTLMVHRYTIRAQLAILGFDTGAYAPDSIDVGGMVGPTGLVPGTTISGVLWEDPVLKETSEAGDASLDPYNVGYDFDLASAVACTDATPNNAAVATVLLGGGGATSTSLIATPGVPGISFS